jgi:hypothetical protein
VGTWNGGPGDSSDFWLTLSRDGRYTLVNDEENFTDSGDVAVHGSRMTWTSSADGSKVSMEWSVDVGTIIGDVLHLRGDGESSWVRA